jgi:hypothetical protein
MSDSPAIDAGTLANVPATDFGGNHRPQGIGYDIGACEYGGTAPPPTIFLPLVSKSSLSSPGDDDHPHALPHRP